MSPQAKIVLTWIGALIAVIATLWLLSGILLPFVLGIAIAYFLDPITDKLERDAKLSRFWATTVISILFLFIAVAVLMLVVPLLYTQVVAFIDALPSIMKGGRRLLMEVSQGKLGALIGRPWEVQNAVKQATGGSIPWLLAMLPSIGSQGLALAQLISLIVVAPVVAFYMLLDWDRMVRRIDQLLPRDHAETIRVLALEVDTVLSGFLRGQGTVCLFLGVFYAAGLSLVGLKFGLVVGIITGVLSFIPYVGTITGFLASLVLASVQFWPDYTQIGLVVGVFVLGQFIEGNFLQPKLVGNRVRLHPVWVMFALFAFAYLFGFVGALIGVPVAAALGVLARYAVFRYQQSKLYYGLNGEDTLRKSIYMPRMVNTPEDED